MFKSIKNFLFGKKKKTRTTQKTLMLWRKKRIFSTLQIGPLIQLYRVLLIHDLIQRQCFLSPSYILLSAQ